MIALLADVAGLVAVQDAGLLAEGCWSAVLTAGVGHLEGHAERRVLERWYASL